METARTGNFLVLSHQCIIFPAEKVRGKFSLHTQTASYWGYMQITYTCCSMQSTTFCKSMLSTIFLSLLTFSPLRIERRNDFKVLHDFAYKHLYSEIRSMYVFKKQHQNHPLVTGDTHRNIPVEILKNSFKHNYCFWNTLFSLCITQWN